MTAVQSGLAQKPAPRGLSESETARYWQDGYLFPIEVASAGQAARWRAELEQIERDWLDADLPLPLNSYKRVNAQCVIPLAWEIASHAPILDAVEAVLGPDLMVYGVEFFIKEPHTRHKVGMHQDLTYWGLGEIDGLLTAWVALSPATTESGCMEFVRASHRNPILPHNDTFSADNLLSRGQEVAVEVADEDRVPIELAPGQMSLHHGLTIHGSGPNRSDDRRIGCVIRYLRPDMSQRQGDTDYAMLVRGEDRFGNFLHLDPPTGLFTPDGLANHDKVRKAQAAVTMAGARDTKNLYGAG